jgi:hypothetical protein
MGAGKALGGSRGNFVTSEEKRVETKNYYLLMKELIDFSKLY